MTIPYRKIMGSLDPSTSRIFWIYPAPRISVTTPDFFTFLGEREAVKKKLSSFAEIASWLGGRSNKISNSFPIVQDNKKTHTHTPTKQKTSAYS